MLIVETATRGLQEPNSVFPLGTMVYYFLIQYLQWLYVITTNNENQLYLNLCLLVYFLFPICFIWFCGFMGFFLSPLSLYSFFTTFSYIKCIFPNVAFWFLYVFPWHCFSFSLAVALGFTIYLFWLIKINFRFVPT